MKRFSKKAILLAVAAAVVLAGLAAGTVFLAKRKPKFISVEQAGLSGKTDVTLTAARGLSALAPANTSPAFALAGQNDYSGVQFEVRRTADGIWVVMAEDRINGTTNGRGKVEKMTYKQLLCCRVNKGHGKKQYKKDDLLTVPTLEQALLICSKYSMTPVIEVKQSGADCVEDLFRCVGGGRKKEYVFVFAEEEQLSKAQELLAGETLKLEQENVLLCRYTQKLSAKALAAAKETPQIGVFFPADKNQKTEQIQSFIDAGLTLYACGVNKPKQAKALYDAGVRRFTTDRLAYGEIRAQDDPAARKMTTAPADAEESSSRRRRPTTAPVKENEPSSRTKRPADPKKAPARTTKKAQ